MKAPSLSAVRETLRETAPGITIRKEDCGEYRVTFTQEAIAAAFPGMTRAERIEKAESLASYDSDICGAYETGKAMFRTGLNPAIVSPEEKAAREAADDMGFAAETVSKESPVAIGKAETVEYIDMTPTWAAMAGTFRLVIENGKAEGRESMWQEIGRGLALADERNAMAARLAAIAEALDSNASPHSRLAAIRAAVES